MNRCPAGHLIIAFSGDNFCYVCGAALIKTAQPFCTCGRELTPGVDRFCPKCGTAVPAETDAMRRCERTGA